MNPAPLALGIGCRRDVTVAQIEHAVRTALGALGTLDAHALDQVQRVATVDSKRDEAALVAFCAHHGLPLVAFSADAIAAAFATDPTLARSPAAQRRLRVDGVCEPCALLAMPGGTLVVRKQTFEGVTVAIAAAAD
jgi:cobalamin biosynthesis protein CbiG